MKLQLSLFATPQFPLRASHLQNLLSCPWREVMIVFGATDQSGQAADTGSAVHAACDTWHKNGGYAADAVDAMRRRLIEYPLADLPEAGGLFLAYALDPRNNNVDLALGETEVTFTLEAPEGPPITIVGHVDQVRREQGILYIHDIKTSKKSPVVVLAATRVQAAAYCKGASALLGEPVHPGGIIMPRRSPMHFPFPWTIDDVDAILAPVIDAVTHIRKGDVKHIPHDGCFWCHTGGPEHCEPQLRYYLPMVT